ncbi:MAG: hypothetical protein WD068_03665, partial [Candidatus Babeliales bacterium]
ILILVPMAVYGMRRGSSAEFNKPVSYTTMIDASHSSSSADLITLQKPLLDTLEQWQIDPTNLLTEVLFKHQFDMQYPRASSMESKKQFLDSVVHQIDAYKEKNPQGWLLMHEKVLAFARDLENRRSMSTSKGSTISVTRFDDPFADKQHEYMRKIIVAFERHAGQPAWDQSFAIVMKKILDGFSRDQDRQHLIHSLCSPTAQKVLDTWHSYSAVKATKKLVKNVGLLGTFFKDPSLDLHTAIEKTGKFFGDLFEHEPNKELFVAMASHQISGLSDKNKQAFTGIVADALIKKKATDAVWIVFVTTFPVDEFRAPEVINLIQSNPHLAAVLKDFLPELQSQESSSITSSTSSSPEKEALFMRMFF